MRVIAGLAKKRRLKSPGKLPVRPTSDRVKEALFNIIGSLVPECDFADLFAGTGGVGLEALSRGARKTVFVENNPQVARILKDNIALTGLQEGSEIIRRDVTSALEYMHRRGDKFDIIFADPPYRQGLAELTLNTLCGYPVHHQGGVLVIETGADETVPEKVGFYFMARREKYGDTALLFYKHSTEGDKFCE